MSFFADLSISAPHVAVGLLVFAIVYVMLGSIMRLGLGAIFFGALAMLFLSWLGFFVLAEEMSMHGLAFDGLTALSLEILLPLLMAVIIMLFYKVAVPAKKVACLLLLLISFLGGIVVLASQNWLWFFVGLQCLSIPIYGLLSFDTQSRTSLSSATTYLVLSMVVMAFLLFGILILYAATGSMEFFALRGQGFSASMIAFGLTFIFVGIAFKSSLAPFHLWAPEVYKGASFFVTTYLLIVVKAIIIVFLARNLFLLLGKENSLLLSVLAGMAIVSMWLGNGLMLIERHFMRFLGYFSIGHIGFIFIALLSGKQAGLEAIFIDIIGFGLGVILLLGSVKILWKDLSPTLDDLQGLAYSSPFLSALMALGLASLAGLPLTVGFIGKYAILRAGVDAGEWSLVVHMVLTSLLGIIAVARYMMAIFSPKEAIMMAKPQKGSLWVSAVAILIIGLGIFPGGTLSFINYKVITEGATDLSHKIPEHNKSYLVSVLDK